MTDAETTVDTTPRRRPRKRTIVTGIIVTAALALSISGVAAAAAIQQAEAAAQAQEVEQHLLRSMELYDEAAADADQLRTALTSISDALEGSDVDTAALEEALADLESNRGDRDSVLSANAAGVAAANAAIRAVVAHGLTVTGDSDQADKDALGALAEAVAALRGAPQGLPTSYTDHGELLEAVLVTSTIVANSHAQTVAAAGQPGENVASGSGSSSGGSGGTSTGGGSSSGGGSSGGGGSSSGGGGSTTPPPPPPHPRAALCASLGFGANGASCLANTPTYVTTNASYVPFASCGDPGAYGSHTPGFGGTSSPSYSFPWSYQIQYASSGLGKVQFYVCD